MSRFDDGTRRAPVTFGDHMSAAGNAQKLADCLLVSGKISQGLFWTRIAQQKIADAMAMQPSFLKKGKAK